MTTTDENIRRDIYPPVNVVDENRVVVGKQPACPPWCTGTAYEHDGGSVDVRRHCHHVDLATTVNVEDHDYHLAAWVEQFDNVEDDLSITRGPVSVLVTGEKEPGKDLGGVSLLGTSDPETLRKVAAGLVQLADVMDDLEQ